jgi:hypothetical protein
VFAALKPPSSLVRRAANATTRLNDASAMTTRLRNYAEVRAYLEKEHPDWLRALTPRHISAPASYWPQEVLAVSSTNAAIQNCINIHGYQTSLARPAFWDC